MPSNNNTGFKLTMAEFKGRVIESLNNIEKQFELNRNQHDVFFDRIGELEKRTPFSLNPIAWLIYWFKR